MRKKRKRFTRAFTSRLIRWICYTLGLAKRVIEFSGMVIDRTGEEA